MNNLNYVLLILLLLLSEYSIADDSGKGDSDSLKIARFENIVILGDAVDVHRDGDSTNVRISWTGTHLIDAFQYCKNHEYRLCLKFGDKFQLALPCDQSSLKKEWDYGGWRYRKLSEFEIADDWSGVLIEARKADQVIVRIIYSYASGIRLFSFVGDLPYPDDESVALPFSSAVYVLTEGSIGESSMACNQI